MDSDEAAAISELRIGHRMSAEVAVVTVTGEVDSVTAPQLMKAVRTGLEATRSGFVILDLTDVRFLGGHGLSALLKASRTAENRQQPLRIVVDSNRPVIRPIQITGLEEFLALYHTVDEALHA